MAHSKASRRTGDMIAGGLWASVVIGFLYVLYRMYGRSHAHSHAHMTPLYTPRTGISLAAKTGGDGSTRKLLKPVAPPPSPSPMPVGLRSYYPKLADLDMPFLDLEKITWEDIESVNEEAMETAIAAWLFAEPVPGLCELRWLPSSKPDEDGSWPLCSGVAIPPPSKCLAYGVGVGGLPAFDSAFPQELGCSMRAFDPTIDPPSYPSGVLFKRIGLSGENHLDASMPVATLSTLQGLENEQGRPLLVLKIDCEGCEWDAFPQMLRDHGPDALRNVDMVMFEIHLGWLNYSPRNAAALVALLHNQGFRQYWRHFNPWSLAGRNTGGVLRALGRIYGAELASQFESKLENFQRLGREYKTYVEEYRDAWQQHVSPGNVFCCFEMAFVREGAITGATNATLISRRGAGRAPDGRSRSLSDKEKYCPEAAKTA